MQTQPPPHRTEWDPASRAPVLRTLTHGTVPEAGRKQQVSGRRRAPPGLQEAHPSVRPAAGLQVRPFADGQHRGVVSGLRKRPLAAAPVGPSTVPLADVPVQNVLDVLHDQVDGDCGRDRRERVSRTHPPPRRPSVRYRVSADRTHVQAWAPDLPAGSARTSAGLEPG